MPYKRFAALAVFMVSMAVYLACSQDGDTNTPPPPKPAQQAQAGDPSKIEWAKDWSTAKARAAADGKLVMIDFYTTWCGPCKQLDRQTFPDPRVVKASKQLIALKQDAEKEGRHVAKEYGVNAFPTILFVDGEGKLRDRIIGFASPDEFAPRMQQIIDNYNKSRGQSS